MVHVHTQCEPALNGVPTVFLGLCRVRVLWPLTSELRLFGSEIRLPLGVILGMKWDHIHKAQWYLAAAEAVTPLAV